MERKNLILFSDAECPFMDYDIEQECFIGLQDVKMIFRSIVVNKKTNTKEKQYMVLTTKYLFSCFDKPVKQLQKLVFTPQRRITLRWCKFSSRINKDDEGNLKYLKIKIKGSTEMLILYLKKWKNYTKLEKHLRYLAINNDFKEKYKILETIERKDNRILFRLGEHQIDREFFGKCYLKCHINNMETVKRIRNNIVNLSLLRDTVNVVNLVDVIETKSEIWIITEFIKGKKLIEKNKKYDHEELKLISKKLLSLVSFLKKRKLVVRDLNPNRILLTSSKLGLDINSIKITSLSFACFENQSGISINGCDEICYMAPEIIFKRKVCFASSILDMYSIGLILLECLTGVSIKDLLAGERGLSLLQKRMKVSIDLLSKYKANRGKLNSSFFY